MDFCIQKEKSYDICTDFTLKGSADDKKQTGLSWTEQECTGLDRTEWE